jgi:hypothetical protein
MLYGVTSPVRRGWVGFGTGAGRKQSFFYATPARRVLEKVPGTADFAVPSRARARVDLSESLGTESNLFARHQTVPEIGGIAMHICYAFELALHKPLGANPLIISVC